MDGGGIAPVASGTDAKRDCGRTGGLTRRQPYGLQASDYSKEDCTGTWQREQVRLPAALFY